MKTDSISIKDIKKHWHILDAKGVTLGKLASNVASILMGKHKPSYTPHMDDGDCVIIINARHIHLTGKKAEQKKYYHHTGYVGHLRETTFADLMAKHPSRAVEKAIYGMLPKNRLGRQQYRNLYVYADTAYKQQAQKPQPLKIF